jgi:hypothetical protein
MFTDVLNHDEMLLDKLSQIDSGTKYRLVYDHDDEIFTGSLGKFAQCVKAHRNVNTIRSKKGEVVDLKMAVSNNLYLRMHMIDNEVYRFHMVLSEREFNNWPNGSVEKRKSSSSFAVNCSLDLLNEN